MERVVVRAAYMALVDVDVELSSKRECCTQNKENVHFCSPFSCVNVNEIFKYL